MPTFLDFKPVPVELEGSHIRPSYLRHPEQWVYCNYPEIIPPDGSALGDRDLGNRYLNQKQTLLRRPNAPATCGSWSRTW